MNSLLAVPCVMVGLCAVLFAWGLFASGLHYTDAGQTLLLLTVAVGLFAFAGANRVIDE